MDKIEKIIPIMGVTLVKKVDLATWGLHRFDAQWKEEGSLMQNLWIGIT